MVDLMVAPAPPRGPRLHGVRERIQVDIPLHVSYLAHDEAWRESRRVVDAADHDTIVLDVAASRPDVTVDIGVDGRKRALSISGPWLTNLRDRAILEILKVASDAMTEGRTLTAMEVVAEALAGGAAAPTVLRPVVVPVNMAWWCTIRLNDGAPAGPVDVWLRTLVTRAVA